MGGVFGGCGWEGGRHISGAIWWGNLKERDYTKDLVIDGRIILRLILDK
jgi:hypothetical protein